MNRFTADEVQDFIRIVNCMSDMDFHDMYKAVIGPKTSMSYTNEKFNQCRSSFLHWICELDERTLDKFMSYCLNK